MYQRRGETDHAGCSYDAFEYKAKTDKLCIEVVLAQVYNIIDTLRSTSYTSGTIWRPNGGETENDQEQVLN